MRKKLRERAFFIGDSSPFKRLRFVIKSNSKTNKPIAKNTRIKLIKNRFTKYMASVINEPYSLFGEVQ